MMMDEKRINIVTKTKKDGLAEIVTRMRRSEEEAAVGTGKAGME